MGSNRRGKTFDLAPPTGRLPGFIISGQEGRIMSMAPCIGAAAATVLASLPGVMVSPTSAWMSACFSLSLSDSISLDAIVFCWLLLSDNMVTNLYDVVCHLHKFTLILIFLLILLRILLVFLLGSHLSWTFGLKFIFFKFNKKVYVMLAFAPTRNCVVYSETRFYYYRFWSIYICSHLTLLVQQISKHRRWWKSIQNNFNYHRKRHGTCHINLKYPDSLSATCSNVTYHNYLMHMRTLTESIGNTKNDWHGNSRHWNDLALRTSKLAQF